MVPAARTFLDRLCQEQILSEAAAHNFLEHAAELLGEYTTDEMLGNALVQAGHLTNYQLDRIMAGTTHGLILGNHRVLERLGAGAMGVVFLAEHMLMRRRVAVKVLPVDEDCPGPILERFYSEMSVLSGLHHPNIVTAFDAGQLSRTGPRMPDLLYLVMEFVSGGDLEQYVFDHGPVALGLASDWIRQAACGLQEAHDHHLIHRDVKPSNLLLNEQGRVKLVDFGLVRQFSSRLTDPRALLGTLEYMALEQSCDASTVDGRADIYGLGATLFWLLTGEAPYLPARSVSAALDAIKNQKPRKLRSLRPDAPEEIENLIDRMMHRDPSRRPSMPITVMNILLPFASRSEPTRLGRLLSGEGDVTERNAEGSSTAATEGPSVQSSGKQKRVLLIDDESSIRFLSRAVLEPLGCHCDEAADAAQAFEAVQKHSYDLLLLDLNLPDMDGYDVCRKLREGPKRGNFKIIVISGRGDQNQLAEALPRGADDYIPKPFGVRQLEARAQHALRLKEAQDQADFLAHQLVFTNRQLENSLAARTSDVRQAQDALLFAMAKMAESRDGETAGHLRRLQRYVRCLAENVAKDPHWAGVINSVFLEQLERCVPLHDIGKIGLPDSILLKPGKLTESERSLMETHTVIGDRMLEALGQEHGESLVFLGTASAIVRHHHERYDGKGYPDKLARDAIPAAARLVAMADVYDALRRRRFHKSAMTHAQASQILLHESTGHFDPVVLGAFASCEKEFERIYGDIHT